MVGYQFKWPKLQPLAYCWVALLLWLMAIAPAQASVLLRIAIENQVSQVKVGSSTRAIVRDSSGRTLGEIPGMTAYMANSSGSGVALQNWQANQIYIQPTGDGYVFIGDRWYRGGISLVRTDGGLTAVNNVNLEHYLYSVIGAEMSPNWPLEALKAQAVAARSYALYQRERGSNPTYDLGDTQGWQVYKGLESEATSTYAAVDATAGQVMVYNGKIIEAFFHSSSGGHTENVEEVWTEARPYLRGVPDYDRGAPVYEWSTSVSVSQLSNLISGVGNIVSVQPEKTTKTGRVITMKVIGDSGQRAIGGEQIQRLLGLKSTRFSIQKANGVFQVYGKGFGHGVGMSQWGAHNLARSGANYQQMLYHYYQNASLAKLQVQ
jgi:stage II sporulation protein D